MINIHIMILSYYTSTSLMTSGGHYKPINAPHKENRMGVHPHVSIQKLFTVLSVSSGGGGGVGVGCGEGEVRERLIFYFYSSDIDTCLEEGMGSNYRIQTTKQMLLTQ